MLTGEIKPERSNLASSTAASENAQPAGFPRKEIWELLSNLDKNEYIQLTGKDIETLRDKEIPLGQVASFIKAGATRRGEGLFKKISDRTETPLDFLNTLRTAPELAEPEERSEPGLRDKIRDVRNELQRLIPHRRSTVEEGEVILPIDEELRRDLASGLSGLTDDRVVEVLARTTGETNAGKVPLKAWLFNPRAAMKVLGAIAEEATAQAGVRKKISETTKWLAEMAGDDVKRDAFLNYYKSLEKALGPYVEPFCQERDLPVPQKDTLGKMTLLFWINTEIVARQTQGREIAKNTEELVKEQTTIQAETAKNKMLAKELHHKTEAVKEANRAKEDELAEKVRHTVASIAEAISVGSIAAIGGLYAGIGRGLSAVAEWNKKVLVGFVALGGTLAYQIVSYAGLGLPSAELWKLFALKSFIVGAVAVGGFYIGSNLVARRKESVSSS